MANLRLIRNRIASVKNTRQITKAMKMVAAAKLRQAEDRLRKSRPYAKKLDDLIDDLIRRTDISGFPLLSGREEPKTAELIVVTSDRGLCGGFNTNILRAAEIKLRELKADYEHVTVSAIGRKARDYFRKREWTLRAEYVNVLHEFDYTLASEIGQEYIDAFEQEKFDEAYIVFNEFLTAMSQNVVVRKFLPLAEREKMQREIFVDYRYEPVKERILEGLLPKEVRYILYKAFIESFAAEMGARMSAMESATKNASEMIDSLTLKLNRARQATITNELMEIISGAEALKG